MTRFQPISPAPATAAALAAAVPPPSPRRRPHWTAMAAVLLAAPFALAGTAQAATITVSQESTGVGNAYNGDDNLCSLVGAIINANTDSTSGDAGCAAGSGADTLVLPGNVTFTLNRVNNEFVGPQRPPRVILSTITIEGNGSTITRASAAPRFRFFQIGNFNLTGSLALDGRDAEWRLDRQ